MNYLHEVHNQICSDFSRLFYITADAIKGKHFPHAEIDKRLSQVAYSSFRIFSALAMASAAVGFVGSVMTGNVPGALCSAGTFIIVHDIFHLLKNREELSYGKTVSNLKELKTFGYDVFTGIEEYFNSQGSPKEAEEAVIRTLGKLQAKNTILKPLWAEIQVGLVKADINPFPAPIR